MVETVWPEYEDLLSEETGKINSQLSEAENLLSDAEDAINAVDLTRRLLNGERVAAQLDIPLLQQESIQKLIQGANNILVDNNLTLELLFESPQEIDVILDSGTRLVGTYNFVDFVKDVLESENRIGSLEPIAARSAFQNIESLWTNVENTDVEAKQLEVETNQQIVSNLKPIQNDLKSDNPELQVQRLQALAPEALRNLPTPTLRTVKIEEQLDARDNLASFDSVSPETRKRRTFVADSGEATPQWKRPPSEFGMPDQPAQPLTGATGYSAALPSLTDTHPLTGATGRKLSESETSLELQRFNALIDAGFDHSEAYSIAFNSDNTSNGNIAATPVSTPSVSSSAEIENFLRTQFGGFEFFLDKHNSELQVGIIRMADGTEQITTADDPNAIRVENVLDAIVEFGLVDPSRIEGALKNTTWWQTSDAQARAFDATYTNMTEPEKIEFLEPVTDKIREELQYLNASMSEEDKQILAADLYRLGDENDVETMRDLIIEKLRENTAFDPEDPNAISRFASARDDIEALSRQYFVPIDTASAGKYAQDIYLGDRSVEQMEQYFKQHALSKFPTLDNAIKNGFTPEEYFAPYKYEIERMLGRPNINLYDEFADVIEYFPDTGEGARPMTMHEVRKYVRGLPEWQNSYQGQSSASALAFAIGKTFGQVA